jgi:ankyrin repeat protein
MRSRGQRGALVVLVLLVGLWLALPVVTFGRGVTPLMLAMGHRANGLAWLLLSAGAAPDFADDGGRTALHYAVRGENPEGVKLLLDRGAAVDARGEGAHTAMTEAATVGAGEAMHLLLKRGANPNVRYADGVTTLHLMVMRCYPEDMILLVRAGADVNAEDSRGYTPLDRAAWSGNMEVGHVLLEAGGTGSLHSLAAFGAVAGVRVLLADGAPVDGLDERGITPLMAAAGGGQVEVARLLVARGANINAGAKYYQSPLWVAVQRDRVKMVAFLLDHGANPSLRDDKGQTPLECSAKWHRDQVALLLLTHSAGKEDVAAIAHTISDAEQGGELTACVFRDWRRAGWVDLGDERQRPMHLAASEGLLSYASRLGSRGVGAGGRDEHGWTPVHRAALASDPEMAASLKWEGDNRPWDVDNQGRTPLHLAARYVSPAEVRRLRAAQVDLSERYPGYRKLGPQGELGGNPEVARVLLDRKTVNAADHEGETPLHIAARNGAVAFARVLLAGGAAVNARNRRGQTPLGLATRHGDREMLRLLRRHGGKQ